jgi:hypothetical protein
VTPKLLKDQILGCKFGDISGRGIVASVNSGALVSTRQNKLSAIKVIFRYKNKFHREFRIIIVNNGWTNESCLLIAQTQTENV